MIFIIGWNLTTELFLLWVGLSVRNQLLFDITKILTSKDVWVERLVFGEYDIDIHSQEKLFVHLSVY